MMPGHFDPLNPLTPSIGRARWLADNGRRVGSSSGYPALMYEPNERAPDPSGAAARRNPRAMVVALHLPPRPRGRPPTVHIGELAIKCVTASSPFPSVAVATTVIMLAGSIANEPTGLQEGSS